MAFVENSNFIKSRNKDCVLDLNDAVQIEGHPIVIKNREKISSCMSTKAFWYSMASVGLCVVAIIVMVGLLATGTAGWYIPLIAALFFGFSAAFTYWWTSSPMNWNSDLGVYNTQIGEMTSSFEQYGLPLAYDFNSPAGMSAYSASKADFDKRELEQASLKARQDLVTATQRRAAPSAASSGLAGLAGVGLGSWLSSQRKGGDDTSEVGASEYVTGADDTPPGSPVSTSSSDDKPDEDEYGNSTATFGPVSSVAGDDESAGGEEFGGMEIYN